MNWSPPPPVTWTNEPAQGMPLPSYAPAPTYPPGFPPATASQTAHQLPFQPSYQPSYQPSFQPSYQPGYQPPLQPGFQPSYQTAAANPFDSRGTTILILGILGFLLCQLLGPVAWIMGNKLRDEAAAAGYPEPGVGKAGRIIGIVATVYLGLIVAFFVIVIIAAVVSSA